MYFLIHFKISTGSNQTFAYLILNGWPYIFPRRFIPEGERERCSKQRCKLYLNAKMYLIGDILQHHSVYAQNWHS